MCKCAKTTSDIIAMVNVRRERNGLDPISYQSFMNHYKTIKSFMPPDRSVGVSYTFKASTARRIVSATWDVRYRSIPRVDWSMYRVA
jgi:hypothetical protein